MSYFNMVAHNPPTIMVSIQSNPKAPNGLKGVSKLLQHPERHEASFDADLADTSNNIRETKEFCCSIISETFLEAANYTSIDAPSGVEEWSLSGLTKRKSE
jgi:flavin reductase (DIM6/NTAB) family NADH-FMN oxidoreductase RutF